MRFLIYLLLAAPLAAQGFVDITATSGLNLPGTTVSYSGRGVCTGDFDNDGDQDAVFAPGWGPMLYYRNDGGGTFTDISTSSGLGASSTNPHATVAADVNNDGYLDLFVASSWVPNQLFINQGNGLFTEEAGARGVAAATAGSYSVSFGDYDRDGWLDLYVGNWQSPTGGGEANILYRNTGNGYFTDVTTASGAGDTGLCFTGVFHDYNDDGWPDIFVGNDKGWYPQNQPDTTYRNNGDGTFTNVGAAVNTQFGIGAMGSDFTDAMNDGGWDIFVSNTQTGHLFHVWNPNTNQYDELANTLGVAAFAEGWACNFFDYDNDGWQDLYIVHAGAANYLYRNPGPGGGPWIEMASTLGCDVVGTQYSSTIADLDEDGRVDLLLPNPWGLGLVLRNTVAAGNWVKIKTSGTVSNRDGIGAIVEVLANGQVQRQQIRTGHGYLGGHDLRAHFGLGTATQADVRITWPSGQVQYVPGISANQVITITEPWLRLGGPAAVGTATSLEFVSPTDNGRTYAMVLALDASPGFPLPDGRVSPANPDWLFSLTLTPGNPILPQPFGTVTSGTGSSPLLVPNLPGLVGLSVYAAAVTGDNAAPSNIASIAGPTTVTFQ